MLKKHSAKSCLLIAGLATVLFLPVTADADKAADRAMKKDGFGLESTRGNNSVAESLRKADGHPVGAPAGMPAGTMAPGMHPGTMAPGTHTGGESSASDACSQTPDDGWQSVTEVRSEADFQIGFNDAVAGRQFSKFDNDSSIVCVGGDVKSVYVGVAASDSNLGAFISSGMGCNLRNDDLSSGGRGVDKLICP